MDFEFFNKHGLRADRSIKYKERRKVLYFKDWCVTKKLMNSSLNGPFYFKSIIDVTNTDASQGYFLDLVCLTNSSSWSLLPSNISKAWMIQEVCFSWNLYSFQIIWDSLVQFSVIKSFRRGISEDTSIFSVRDWIIPMPWNTFWTSIVYMWWSALSALYCNKY